MSSFKPATDISAPKGPTTRQASGPAATLDLAHLAAQTGADQALQREILALFVGQIGEILTALHDPAAPLPARADLAHKLSGSARAIGAFALAGIAETLEAGFRAGHSSPSALQRLPAAAEAALIAIRTHLAALR